MSRATRWRKWVIEIGPREIPPFSTEVLDAYPQTLFRCKRMHVVSRLTEVNILRWEWPSAREVGREEGLFFEGIYVNGKSQLPDEVLTCESFDLEMDCGPEDEILILVQNTSSSARTLRLALTGDASL